MAGSTAEFYLDIFRRGVRVDVRPTDLKIDYPSGLPATIREEIGVRRPELDRHLRRLKGLSFEQNDVPLSRKVSRELSRLRFDRHCLVLIRPGDLSRAIFLPHAQSGLVAPIEKLSRLFPEGQAIFAFQAIGLNDERDALSSIEEIAAFYVAQMKIVKPDSPYFVGGWSLGGHIAFEMARQIIADGGDVGLLAILDSRLPLPQFTERDRWLAFYRYASFSEQTSGLDIFDPDHPFWRLDHQGRLAFILSVLETSSDVVFPRNTTFDSLKRHFAYLNAVCDAQGKYRPQRYPGPITFFRAENCPEAVVSRWAELTSGAFQTVDIPGNHLLLMEDQNRGVVTERLVASLERAQRASAMKLAVPAN